MEPDRKLNFGAKRILNVKLHGARRLITVGTKRTLNVKLNSAKENTNIKLTTLQDNKQVTQNDTRQH